MLLAFGDLTLIFQNIPDLPRLNATYRALVSGFFGIVSGCFGMFRDLKVNA
jgi:hypothetical protein